MMNNNFASYRISYALLVKDFETLLEYIHPCNANLKTYSHRTYELLLRTCTEFENIAKEKLIADGNEKAAAEMSMRDYKQLNRTLQLDKIKAGFNQWDPKSYIDPFDGWRRDKGLPWYQAYNEVKHNRTDKFSQATFENLTNALAAVHLILYRIFNDTFFNEEYISIVGVSVANVHHLEFVFRNSKITVCTDQTGWEDVL